MFSWERSGNIQHWKGGTKYLFCEFLWWLNLYFFSCCLVRALLQICLEKEVSHHRANVECCVFGVKPRLNSSDKPFNLQWRWSCVTKQSQALSHVSRFSLWFCYKSLTSNGPLHLWHKLEINTKCLIRPAFFLTTSYFLACQGTVYLFKCFLLKSKRQNWIPASLCPLKCKRVAGRWNYSSGLQSRQHPN